MSTASGSTTVNAFQQIDQLRQQAEKCGNEHQDLLRQAQQRLDERNAALKQLSDIATQAASGSQVITGISTPVNTSVTGPKRGRPAGSTKATTAAKPATNGTATTGRRGRRIEGNETSLKAAVWEVLDRKPSTYKQYLPDYPTGASGLKVAEIHEIISREGKWKSTAANITTQIQQHVYNLKGEGKVIRNDDKRYLIVDGAELNGPKLDDNGKPIA